MTRKEFEERLRALEAQHQADVALMNAAHEARVRSLESLWRAVAPADGNPHPAAVPAPASAPPQPAPKRRRKALSLLDDLHEVFPDLPDLFDKNDIGRALGYAPARTTLFRALSALERVGVIKAENPSIGGTTSRYRKLDPEE